MVMKLCLSSYDLLSLFESCITGNICKIIKYFRKNILEIPL